MNFLFTDRTHTTPEQKTILCLSYSVIFCFIFSLVILCTWTFLLVFVCFKYSFFAVMYFYFSFSKFLKLILFELP